MEKVIVGMSGGVDSAVAALKLKQCGYDVVGIFMKNWNEKDAQGECTSTQDYEDARQTCEKIGIPCYTVNFEKEYYERVFKYFLSEYKAGRTPNPDVLCNSEIKFSAFLDFAKKSGAEYLATGHYARIERTDDTLFLKKGLDNEKDQSYFLCMLKKEQLINALFPVGELKKQEVREIAKEYGLNVADKKDSTGICFIGERNFRKFLQSYIPAQPGDMVDETGKTVGKHIGLMYYTLGQRRGLDIGGPGGRWFVIKKDVKNNILVVSQNEDLTLTSFCDVDNLNFINPVESCEFECSAKFRYRQPDQKVLIKIKGTGAHIEFSEKQRAVTPGQYAVFYSKDICLGGGIIV